MPIQAAKIIEDLTGGMQHSQKKLIRVTLLQKNVELFQQCNVNKQDLIVNIRQLIIHW